MELFNKVNSYSAIAIILMIAFFMIFYSGRKGKLLNSSTLIIFLYLSSIAGSWLLDKSLVPPIEEYSLYASLLFTFCFILLCLPLVLARVEYADVIYCVNENLFFKIAKFIILLNVLVYFYFLPSVYSLIFSGESIINLRSSVVGGNSFTGAGIIFNIVSVASQFYPVAILFFFYSYANYPERKCLNRLLLWSSTGYIINVLASVGRDGVVLWSLSFIFSYLIFSKSIDKVRRAKIKKSVFILMSLFVFAFVILSIGRFYRDGNLYMFFQYLLMYFSQQFGEFNQYVNNVYDIDCVWSDIFPLLKLFASESNTNYTLLDEHYHFLANHGFSKFVFKTFIGSFYMSVGSSGIIILSMVFGFVFSIIFGFRKKENISLGMLILYTVYAQVLLHGIFYYKLGYTVSHIYILVSVGLSVIFHYKIRYNNIDVF